MNQFAIQRRSLRSAFLALLVYIFLISSVCCKNLKTSSYNNRLKNIKSILAAAVILTHCNPSYAADGKQFNLPSTEVEKIVADDIKIRQALITADFTRSLYSESCRFQDEIDVYPIDDYVRGTKLLFNPALSHVDLIGPVTTVSDSFSEWDCGTPSRSFDGTNRLLQREMGPARCRCHKVGEILDHFEVFSLYRFCYTEPYSKKLCTECSVR